MEIANFVVFSRVLPSILSDTLSDGDSLLRSLIEKKLFKTIRKITIQKY